MIILAVLGAAGVCYLVKKVSAGTAKRHTQLRSLAATARILPKAASPVNGVGRTVPDVGHNVERRAQMQPPVHAGKSEMEKAVDRKLAIGGCTFGVSVAAAFLYPPLALLALPGFAVLAAPIYQAAYRSLKRGEVKSEAVDSVAIALTLVTGHFVICVGGALLYFCNKKLLIKTEDHSTRKYVDMFRELPRFVWLVLNGVQTEVPIEQVRSRDIIDVRSGDLIPVDGRILQGHGAIDERMLTGESQPAEKRSGDRCFASTLVLAGHFTVEVEKSGADTVAAQIGQALHKTVDFKETMVSKGQAIADESALPLLLLSCLSIPSAGLTGGAAILSASLGMSVRMVSPILVLNYLAIASQQGILVKDGRSLERLREIDTLVFDKTGTLTLDQPDIAGIHTVQGGTEDELLIYAAAAEYRQTHPIALAILQEARTRELNVPRSGEPQYEIGYGIRVNLEGQAIHAGSGRFMSMSGVAIPPEISRLEDDLQDGCSFVYIAVDRQIYGAIELHPAIRPEAKAIVEEFRARKIGVAIISGDREQPTRLLAEQLGIDTYYAGVLPEDKGNFIARLQAEKKRVCFVGDGINDAIALKKADVSVSLKGASTIATDSAQIVLMDGTLHQLPALFDAGRRFQRHMRINIATSFLPSLTTIFGVFFLGFGIPAAVLLAEAGLLAAFCSSMEPLLFERNWLGGKPTQIAEIDASDQE